MQIEPWVGGEANQGMLVWRKTATKSCMNMNVSMIMLPKCCILALPLLSSHRRTVETWELALETDLYSFNPSQLF